MVEKVERLKMATRIRNEAPMNTIINPSTHSLTNSSTHPLIGRVGSLLEVGTGFHPELTGRENIYFNGAILGMENNNIKFTPARAYERLLGGRIT